MDTMDTASSGRREVAYVFDRSVCFGWTVFSTAIVIACIIIAVVAGDQMFVQGFLPGWLFGSLGAAFFSIVGLSWAGRLLHSGPALILDESGISADKRLGGITNPTIDATIAWEDVDGASTGPHGSVLLHLSDPEAFWARQGVLRTMMAWHPWRGRQRFVSLGGNDLAAAASEVVAGIEARANWMGLEGPNDRPPLSEPTGQDEG
jgi:hypothetical protein